MSLPKFKMHFDTRVKEVNIRGTFPLLRQGHLRKARVQGGGNKDNAGEQLPPGSFPRRAARLGERPRRQVFEEKEDEMKTKAKAASKAPHAVNTIWPGPSTSRIVRGTIAAIGVEEVIASGMALKRLWAPEDIAGTCLFLINRPPRT